MTRPSLNRFWNAYRLELRLNVFHWGYLMLVGLWSAFIVITYANDALVSIRTMLNFVLGFSSLIGLVLSGIFISRSKRNRFDRLEITFPNGVELVFARWLAILTALCGLLIAPLIVSLLIPAWQLDSAYAIRGIAVNLLSLAFISGLVVMIEHTIGMRRWMYPFLMGLWILAGMLPATLRQDDLPIPGVGLLNFIMMEMPSNNLWGTLIQGQMPFWHNLFYVGLVALFAGMIWWRNTLRHFYRHSLGGIVLTVAALALVILSAGGYIGAVAAVNHSVRVDREQRSEILQTRTSPDSLPFVVSEYVITLNPAEASLSAEMTVFNRGDAPLSELAFSLNWQFEVTEASLPFTREGQNLVFTLSQPLAPGEETVLQVDYEGALWVVVPEIGRSPEATDFVQPGGVNLNYDSLWYPVAGNIPAKSSIIDTETGQTITPELDEPAAVRLSVVQESDSALMFTSNLPQVSEYEFASLGTTWIELLGIPGLHTETDGAVTMVSMASIYDSVKPMVDEIYQPLSAYVQRYFPDAPDFLVQAFSLSWPKQTPYTPLAEHHFIALSIRNHLAEDPQGHYLDGARPVFSGLFGGAANLFTENVAYFLWAHYYSNGDADVMRTLIYEGIPRSGGGTVHHFSQTHEERYAIAVALYEIYAREGEGATFELLERMRQEAGTLGRMSADAIIAWLEDVPDVE